MAKNRKNRGPRGGGAQRRDEEARDQQRSQDRGDRGAQQGSERDREREQSSRGESRSGTGQEDKGRKGDDR